MTQAVDKLTELAAAQGDKAAVIDDRPGESVRQMTFAELDLFSNRIANGLISAGVELLDRVIWCGQNSLELMAMMHAARKAGATAVPLNYRLSDEESAYVVDNSDAVVVWADAEFAELFHRIRDDIPKVTHVVIFGGPALAGQSAVDDFIGDDTAPSAPPSSATMIYTSGTTGRPKGAYKDASGTVEQSGALLAKIGYRPDDVYVTCGPLYHSGPGGFAAIAHRMGNTVVVQHKFEAEDWLRLIDTYSCSSTFSAPTPIRMVTNLDDDVKAKYDVSSMRVMIANAAPWSFALKEAYVRDFPPESLWEVYGSTEMGVNTVLEPGDQMRKPGSCGKPAPMVDVRLYAEGGGIVDTPREPGELWVKATTVLDTYHGAQEKFDAEHNEQGWHTVGDVAYYDEDGFFYICDRKKDMIISGGMNIYPAEIEAALEMHAGIYEAAVFAIPSEEWGETVHACIVRNDERLTQADIDIFSREKLASYKIPRSIEFLTEIPKTGSNKILKRELRQKYWKGHETQVGA